MVHTLTLTEATAPRYEYTVTCSCGWACTDPTLPWLSGYARQHAARGNSEWA